MKDYFKWLFSRSYRLKLKRERDETFAKSLINLLLMNIKESGAEWLPIETAPKDREIYVCGLAKVWADSDPFAWQGEASWDQEEGGWITGGYDDSGDFLFVEATHWMESRVVEYPEVPPYVSDDPELNPSERMTPFTNTYNWGRLS